MPHYRTTMKVVINRRYGGFGLSRIAMSRLVDRGFKLAKGDADYLHVALNASGYFSYDPINLQRHDPLLVQVVEELGEQANGDSAKLRVVEIDVGYEINSYDGMERIV